jgi:hypothetical protein
MDGETAVSCLDRPFMKALGSLLEESHESGTKVVHSGLTLPP